MEILATYNTSIGDKLGYYGALVRERGKRKVYAVTLSIDTNEVLRIENVYPSKKAAFAATGAR